jgi:tetratricopeptide (TPR) repeat protein
MQTAEKHYKEGQRRFNAGEWELAHEELMLCLKHDPWKRKYSRFYSQIAARLIARHYRQEAEELLLQGRFSDAITSYRQLLKLKINSRECKRLIHQTKRLQQSLRAVYEEAHELLVQEKLTKARRKVLELLEQIPKCEDAQTLLALIEKREQAQELYAQGSKLYREGRYEEARRLLEQSLALDREYSTPQMLLERVNHELGRGGSDLRPEPEHGMPLEESILLLEEVAEGALHDKDS